MDLEMQCIHYCAVHLGICFLSFISKGNILIYLRKHVYSINSTLFSWLCVLFGSLFSLVLINYSCFVKKGEFAWDVTGQKKGREFKITVVSLWQSEVEQLHFLLEWLLIVSFFFRFIIFFQI